MKQIIMVFSFFGIFLATACSDERSQAPATAEPEPLAWQLRLIEDQGFDDLDNIGIGRVIAHGEYLYAGTWNNESGAGAASSWDDDLSYGTTGLARGWSVFSGGSGNREDNESGRDGVNVRDYYWNNTSRYTASQFFETFIRHNCLQDQTND